MSLRRPQPLPAAPAGLRALAAIMALAIAASLSVAALFLGHAQHRRERDIDARLSQQAKVGAAMLASLRESTVSSLAGQYGRDLGSHRVSARRLTVIARRSGALYAEMLDADGRVESRTPRSPHAIGLGVGDPDFQLARVGGRTTVTIAAPVGRRTLVLGLPQRETTEFLTRGLSRLPSAWPADLYALDGTGRVVSGWGADGHTPGRPSLSAAQIADAARRPLRLGNAAIATAPIDGTSWSFAVKAPRRQVDATVSGTALVLPWGLLGVATLAAALVLLLVLRSRRSAEALSVERERALAVLSVLSDGYLFVRDGRVVDVNDRLCVLAGVERDELLGASEDHPLVRAVTVAGSAGDGGELHAVLDGSDGTGIEVAVSTRDVPGGHGQVSVVRDITPQKREERRLSRLATTDALTGLANRGAFDVALAEHVALARETGAPLSLVLFDVDRFKAVNDGHGHPVGDQVLAEVGRRLADVIRAGDVVARIGGEEFAWLLPGLDAEAAERMADRARRAVTDRPFPTAGRLSLSAGTCPLGHRDAAGLYACADRALLTAKRSGRDRTVAISPQPVAA